MTTSANSIEYSIYKGDNDKEIGHFRKNVMCKLPDYAELLKYQPLSEHTIQPWGYDEEEDEWEDKFENLEEFLKPMMPFNKKIREFFNGEKTADQIMQEMEEERKESVRKMHEYYAREREKMKAEYAKKNGNEDRWIPTVKLSDTAGKHTGDTKMIEVCKYILNIN